MIIKYATSLILYFLIYRIFSKYSGYNKVLKNENKIDNLINLFVGNKNFELKFHLTYAILSLFLLRVENLYLYYLYQIFLSFMILLSAIDIKAQVIPDKITIPAFIFFVIYKAILLPQDLKSSIIGGLVGALITIIIIIITLGGLGGGDWRLNGLIGFVIGYPQILQSLIVSSIIAGVAIIGFIQIGLIRLGNKTYIPYGPFFCIGAFLVLLGF